MIQPNSGGHCSVSRLLQNRHLYEEKPNKPENITAPTIVWAIQIRHTIIVFEIPLPAAAVAVAPAADPAPSVRAVIVAPASSILFVLRAYKK